MITNIKDDNERARQRLERSPERAEEWYRGLFKQIETLKKFHQRCPRAEESEDYGEELRLLTYGKRSDVFRILAIRDDVIRIIAMHHGAQDSIEF